MTSRSVAWQGGLAALGLLAAHLTWQREPEHSPGEVAVIDASKNDVSHLRYEDADGAMDLERRTGDGDPVVWLHLVDKVKAAEPAGKDGATPAPAPSTAPRPPRDLRGNADATKLYERFAPLVAPRAFGVLEASKLKELGLDAPTRKLEVTVKGDVRKYDIGIAMHAQNSESFLRDARDGRIYLMPHGLLADLGNSKRLIDPRLHVIETRDFDRVVVTVGGKRRELVHLGRENFSTEGYASAKTPDKRDQLAKNWTDLLWRTFPMEVLGRGELPKEGAPKIVLRVDYFEGQKSVGWIELGRTEGDASKTTSEGAQPLNDLYARSEHTVGWTKLHASEQLLTDADRVVATP
jgi:hypothetical protein